MSDGQEHETTDMETGGLQGYVGPRINLLVGN